MVGTYALEHLLAELAASNDDRSSIPLSAQQGDRHLHCIIGAGRQPAATGLEQTLGIS